jgi:hypothetical protein
MVAAVGGKPLRIGGVFAAAFLVILMVAWLWRGRLGGTLAPPESRFHGNAVPRGVGGPGDQFDSPLRADPADRGRPVVSSGRSAKRAQSVACFERPQKPIVVGGRADRC